MGNVQKFPPPPPYWSQRQPETFWEPPPALPWADRHPHLATVAIWSVGVAFLWALSWVFA
jgi:hypothetical protein